MDNDIHFNQFQSFINFIEYIVSAYKYVGVKMSECNFINRTNYKLVKGKG